MKYTKETLAALLNGREMGDEITQAVERDAKDAGLVVVFGYSDDNVELRGAINDELSAYRGRLFRVTREGVNEIWRDGEEKGYDEAEEYFHRKNLPGADITAVWHSAAGNSWSFETVLPHAAFDILEDGEPFCRGIVFSLEDLPK